MPTIQKPHDESLYKSVEPTFVGCQHVSTFTLQDCGKYIHTRYGYAGITGDKRCKTDKSY